MVLVALLFLTVSPAFYEDIYGRKRDRLSHFAIFEPSRNNRRK